MTYYLGEAILFAALVLTTLQVAAHAPRASAGARLPDGLSNAPWARRKPRSARSSARSASCRPVGAR